MGAGSVAKFLTNLGKKAFSEVDEFIGTAVKMQAKKLMKARATCKIKALLAIC